MTNMSEIDCVVMKRIWGKQRADGRVLLGAFYSTPELRRLATALGIVWSMPRRSLTVTLGEGVTFSATDGTSRETLLNRVLDAVYSLKDSAP